MSRAASELAHQRGSVISCLQPSGTSSAWIDVAHDQIWSQGQIKKPDSRSAEPESRAEFHTCKHRESLSPDGVLAPAAGGRGWEAAMGPCRDPCGARGVGTGEAEALPSAPGAWELTHPCFSTHMFLQACEI